MRAGPSRIKVLHQLRPEARPVVPPVVGDERLALAAHAEGAQTAILALVVALPLGGFGGVVEIDDAAELPDLFRFKAFEAALVFDGRQP